MAQLIPALSLVFTRVPTSDIKSQVRCLNASNSERRPRETRRHYHTALKMILCDVATPRPILGSQAMVGTAVEIAAQQLALQRIDTPDHHGVTLRRGFRLIGALLCFLTLGYLFSREHSISPTDYAARTDHVMSTTPLIDGHNDMPYLIRFELEIPHIRQRIYIPRRAP